MQKFVWRDHLNFLVLGFVFCYALYYFFFGERLLVREGLGWDGLVYAAYAQDFLKELRITASLDPYHVTRFFPSLLIWSLTKLLRISIHSPRSVFNAFFILNTLCFMLIAYLWGKICELKQFEFETKLFGYICFFCNFVFLKYYQYAAILTDVFALLLGMLALYCFLKKSRIGPCILMPVTFFTWPIGSPFLLLMALFNKKYPKGINNVAENVVLRFSIAFVYTLTLLILAKLPYTIDMWDNKAASLISINIATYSALIAGFYVFGILRQVPLQSCIKCLRFINLKDFLIILPGFVLSGLLYYYCVHRSSFYYHNIPPIPSSGIFSFLFFYIPTGPLLKPGLFFIMQVICWGPLVFLCFFFAHKMFKKSFEEGIALALLLLVSFYFGLNPQYRFNIYLMPLTIYLLCSVMDDLKINLRFCLWFLFVSLFCSKFYVPFNVGDLPLTPLKGDLFQPDMQRFFMNSGYWVSTEGYIITGTMTLITGCLLALGLFNSNLFKIHMIHFYEKIRMYFGNLMINLVKKYYQP